jgi:AAA15 family ATPase/GTPase
MIIEFTIGNFLSFYEKRTISFEATGISELKQNVINIDHYKLLRSLVIYGANSSGKSNVIKAFDIMKACVMYSVKLNDSDKLHYSPFLLSEESAQQPSFFEIVFLHKTQRFRYGFEYNLTEIVSEWLFVGKTSKTEKILFIRTSEGIGVSEHFKEGKGKETATNANRLFLSLVAQLNGEISKQVMDCFANANVLSGIQHEGYGSFSLSMLDQHSRGYKESLDFFKKLQLGFKDIEIIEADLLLPDLPDDMPSELKSHLIKDLSKRKLISKTSIRF